MQRSYDSRPKMMDNSGDGLIQDLEDETINFWDSLDTATAAAAAAAQPHNPIQMHPYPSDPEPFVGMLFDSADSAKTFYIAYAARIGFSVRTARSRRSKSYDSIIMLRFVCSREGFSKPVPAAAGDKKTRKRNAFVREGCQAMLEVVKRGDNDDGNWVVTKLVKEHNHELGIQGRVHYIATDGADEFEPFLGMEFDSLELARMFYYTYASRMGFEARVRQSRRSPQDESIRMLKLVCSKHRYHSGRDNSCVSDDNQGVFLDLAREGCEALFEVVRKDGDRWVVTKLVLEHSHELSPCLSRIHCVRSQGEVLVIAKNFADARNLLLNGQGSQNHPREIRYNDLGLKDTQDLLQYFDETQATNPAFYYALQVGNNNFMTNIFWADAKARMAYNYFGDVVVFDTTYRKNKDLMPLAIFRGLNHHLQPVVFGCAFLVDDSEASFVWLFESWLAAMSGRHPVSLVTDIDMAMLTAVAKVFPSTSHSFCKEHILSTIHKELPDLCSMHTPFELDLRRCVDDSETAESFESCWDSIVEKYNLRGNAYLQYLYQIRYQWVPIYLKGTFFADVSALGTSEIFGNMISKYFTMDTPLWVAVKQLEQALANCLEKESQADFETVFSKPILKTASPMEKQASGIYTRTIFNRFQEEFLESLGYHVDKIKDGEIRRYQVGRSEDPWSPSIVTFNTSENKAHCSCCMFEFSGILCRHVLRVFIILGIRTIPKCYILKRLTRNAKCITVSDEYGVEIRGNSEEPSTMSYNDLCCDGISCAREGSTSVELYKVAKDALRRAIAEIVSAKQNREQPTSQSFIRSQKKHKSKLPKDTPKEEYCGKNTRFSYQEIPSEELMI